MNNSHKYSGLSQEQIKELKREDRRERIEIIIVISIVVLIFSVVGYLAYYSSITEPYTTSTTHIVTGTVVNLNVISNSYPSAVWIQLSVGNHTHWYYAEQDNVDYGSWLVISKLLVGDNVSFLVSGNTVISVASATSGA